MDTDLKKNLCLTGDSSLEAAASRATAARKVANLNQSQLAVTLGVTRTAVSNFENGRSFPSQKFMLYMMEEQRIDPAFFLIGKYQSIPEDVQAELLKHLNDSGSKKTRVSSQQAH